MTLPLNTYHKIDIHHDNKGYCIKNIQTRACPVLISSLALALLLINGCSESPEYQQQSSADVESAQYESSGPGADVLGIAGLNADMLAGTEESQANKLNVENLADDSEQTLGSQATDIEIAGKKLLIRARANFKVADVVKSSSAIESLTRQQGGYIALSNITNIENGRRTFTKGAQDITLTTYHRQATMTVRIPKAKVTEFLKQVQQQVAFLKEQEFSTQDVTLDIYREQLAAKLNSNMASELSQQRLDSSNDKDQGSNVSAITATYAARQQQQYAQLQQMDIADKIKYSTIDLTFMQPASSYKEVSQNLEVLIEAERPSFGAQVSDALKTGWETLKTVVIRTIGLWWFIVIVGIFYLLYRFMKMSYRQLVTYRKRHKKKPVLNNEKPLPNKKVDPTDDK